MCKFKTGTNADYNKKAGFNFRSFYNKLQIYFLPWFVLHKNVVQWSNNQYLNESIYFVFNNKINHMIRKFYSELNLIRSHCQQFTSFHRLYIHTVPLFNHLQNFPLKFILLPLLAQFVWGTPTAVHWDYYYQHHENKYHQHNNEERRS